MTIFSIFTSAPLLMAPASGPNGQSGDPTPSFIMLGAMVLIFYFLIFRPQKKRQKAREALVQQIEKGDKVVTASGIHGTISQIEDTTVLLQVSDNTKIRIEKSAIGNVTPKNAEKAA